MGAMGVAVGRGLTRCVSASLSRRISSSPRWLSVLRARAASATAARSVASALRCSSVWSAASRPAIFALRLSSSASRRLSRSRRVWSSPPCAPSACSMCAAVSSSRLLTLLFSRRTSLCSRSSC